MSQLDSMLLQLKKRMEEQASQSGQAIVDTKEAPLPQDAAKSRQALEQFICKMPMSHEGIERSSISEPALQAMRKHLFEFIQASLTNTGKAPSGKIDLLQSDTSHSSNDSTISAAPQASGHRFVPPPGTEVSWIKPCPTCTAKGADPRSGAESPAQSTPAPASRLSDTQAVPTSHANIGSSLAVIGRAPLPVVPNKKDTPASTDAPSGASDSLPEKEAARAKVDEPLTVATPDKDARSQGKSAVKAFLDVLTLRPKAELARDADRSATEQPDHSERSGRPDASRAITKEEPVPPHKVAPVRTPKSNGGLMWFKHIQSVEAALRIGDVHFAGVLVDVLTETAAAMEAEANITCRLRSFAARISIELKRYEEAEKLLTATIKELSETAFAGHVTSAYCWYALAQCYQRQQRVAEAKEAHQRAIQIATAALGPKDPETLLLLEPPA